MADTNTLANSDTDNTIQIYNTHSNTNDVMKQTTKKHIHAHASRFSVRYVSLEASCKTQEAKTSQ